MQMLANTTISVYQGQTVNGLGDPVDNETLAMSGIPANITVKSTYSRGETSTLPQVITYATCRVRCDLDIDSNSRIVDETTGESYIVHSTQRPVLPGMRLDRRLMLQLVE